MKTKQIQNSLILAFATLIIFTIVVLGLLSFYLFGQALTRHSQNNADQVIGQLNYVLDTYISYMDNLSLVAIYHSDVQDYIRSQTAGSPTGQVPVASINPDGILENRITMFLKLLTSVRKDITSIILLLDNGRMLTDKKSDEINPNIDIREQQWFRSVPSDPIKTSLSAAHVQNLINNDKYPWVVTLSRILCNLEDLKRKGVLLVDLNYNIIRDLCSHVRLGKSSYVFIVNSEGEIVYHPRQELIYSKLKTELIEEVLRIRDGFFEAKVQGNKIMYTVKTSAYTGWTTVGVSYLDELFYNQKELQYYYFLTAIFCFIATIIISIFISSRISRPIKTLRSSMQAVTKGNFDIDIRIDCRNEVAELAHDCNIAIKKIKELIVQNKKEQELKRKYELETLQAQVNPHFLYNTLDSIIWMIECAEYEDAIVMTDSLASLFRLSINKGKDIISIRDMIEHISCYLIIQKKRYKDKMDYSLIIDPGIYEYKTIKLLIQPLVENAIYHGIKNKEGIGHLTITGKREDGLIVFEIIDNGVGMSAEALARLIQVKDAPFPAEYALFDPAQKSIIRAEATPPVQECNSPGKKSINSSGVGVRNVQARIRLYFGEEYGISYKSKEGEGTIATVKIPILNSTDLQEKP